MIVTLAEIKEYLRLEPTDIEEDGLINSFLATAEEYLKGATGFTFASGVPERAKLIVKLLVSHWYDNRAIMTTAPNVNKIDFTVQTLLSQLTYSHVEGEQV